MTGRPSDVDSVEIPPILPNSPTSETELHQEFVLRHIDFLIDTLTAEQYNRQWKQPAGCPTASPEIQSRRRSSGQMFPCRYEEISVTEPDPECPCADPLAGSDDPLDTVAAVAIARDDRTPAERYFDTEDRTIIAGLRENVGSWNDIADLDESQMEAALTNATNRRGVRDERVDRLKTLLGEVSQLSYTEGVTLSDLGGIPYPKFAEVLSSLPGVSPTDAWWLMLTAFDKPVWPADPFIDGLLCSLGLLKPDDHLSESERREFFEEELPPRHIPQLHRALAGHAVKGSIDVCSDACEIRKFLLTHRLREQASETDGPVVVDLFSGAGGLSLGFSHADWSIELAIDNDRDATDTYRFNHPEIPHRKIVCGDIREELEQGLLEKVERRPDVVVGGPPCQSLSQAGYRSRLADDESYSILDDDRTELYQEYVDVIEELRPKALVMENVEGMVNEIGDSGVKVGDLVINALESIGAGEYGYTCDYRLIDCSQFGIPQQRERVFIVGVREDLSWNDGDASVEALFDMLNERRSSEEFDLKQALSGLPKLRRGEGGRAVPKQVRGSKSDYVRENSLNDRTSISFNHQAREHPMEKDQILFDEALEPGDTGWDIKYAKSGEYAHLIEYDVGTAENPRFKDKYRMLRWSDPAPTVVAHLAKDSNNFVLPDYYQHAQHVTGEPDPRRNRGVTPREAARIQSFPDEFVFLGPFTSWYRQVGNAVPPIFGEHMGDALKEFLNHQSPRPMNSTSAPPERASTDD